MQVSVSRRQFLKVSAGTVAAVAVADKVLALTALQPVIEVGNPLGEYPDRSWERVYHDQYRYDSSFTWCCSPNDTHGCRIRAFVRNGVVMRVEQNYDHQTYEDLYGNRGTFAHNPRMCLKGFTFHRRVYGPYRLKGPLMRKGWKEWMDAGSPELTPEVKRKYKFDARFLDDMMRVSWDTAFTYAAKGCILIATRYSGEAGARRSPGAGLCAGNDRDDEGRGGALLQASRRHAGARHHRQDDEHAVQRWSVAAAGFLDSQGGSGQGTGRQVLFQLHLARRPGPVPSVVERHAELRRRPLRHALLQAEHQLGQELRREQDAGSALEARVDRARRPHRRDHAGVQSDGLSGGLLDSGPAANRWRLFLGRCKIILDENLQDIDYIKEFTDMPLARPHGYSCSISIRAMWSPIIKFPDFSKSYSGRIQVLEAGADRTAGRHDGVGPQQEAGGAAAPGAGRLPLSSRAASIRP